MEITAEGEVERSYEQDETYQGYYFGKADCQKFIAALRSEFGE